MFICHSSLDHEFINKLIIKFKKDNISIWIDDYELQIGDSITEKINEGLNECNFFIIIFSENSIKSDWVKKEINATLMRQLLKKDIKIIPILLNIEPNLLPPLMMDIYGAKFKNNIIDEHEYKKIIEVLLDKSELNSLHEFQDRYFDNIEHIDIIIRKENPTKHEVAFILKIIQEEIYNHYFFQKINILIWFGILKEKKYFSSQKAPGSIKSDKEGYITIPFWNVLDYLERVSQEANKPENREYTKDIIEIIIDVTQNGPKDNFKTWWYFAKIISNLPIENITNELIDFIPNWFDSPFGASLQGKEITDRLLPKFLDSDKPEDIQKAELIIKYLTELKRKPEEQIEKEKKFHEEKYMPLLDGYWLSEALEKNAEKIAHKCSNSVIYDLQRKIEKLLEEDSSRDIINYHNHTLLFSLKSHENYLLEIYEFEKELSEDELFILFRDLREEEKTDILNNAKKSFEKLINISSLTEFLDVSCNLTIDIYPEFKDREAELKRFLMHLHLGLYDGETYESFYNKETIYFNKTFGVFHFFLETIISLRIKKFPEETKDVLHSFLYGKYLYLVKCAFYIIGLHYDELKELFCAYIKQDTNNLFLKTTYFGDEIGEIFKQINSESKEITDLIEKKIEEEFEIRAAIEKDIKYMKSWKQRYYKALSHIEKFNDKYLKLKNETGVDPDLGPAIQMGESRVGPGPSPFSKEDMFKMSNEKLAHHLKEFKTTDPWDGPTEGGLADQLKQIARSNPLKFIDNMMPFINTAYFYIYYIFWGLTDAWNNDETFNWQPMLEFIYNYINLEVFWNNELAIKGDLKSDQRWVSGVIGTLIQDGTKKDEHTFAQELNEKALDIIEIILNKLEIKDEKGSFDSVTYALNSSFGKILSALINLSLKDARHFDKSPNSGRQRWNSRAKNFYETALKNNIKEAYTLFGQYLSNFHYLDEKWTEEKINNLKKYNEKDILWNLFMEGYLFSSKVYNDIYVLMARHYEIAITKESSDESFHRKLTHHIAIGYLRDIDDKLDQSLYKIVADKWNPLHIKEMVGFFWMQRDYLTKDDSGDDKKSQETKKKYIDRILKFWELIYKRYKDKISDDLTVEDKKILGSSAKLSIFLNEIDEINCTWMKLSAPYIEIEFNAPFFIEYLNDLKDKGDNKAAVANFVADIFLEILKSFIPDYDKKNIFAIVEYLFEISKLQKDFILKDKTIQICNIYGPSRIKDDNGHEFLRDLYEEYNPTI